MQPFNPKPESPQHGSVRTKQAECSDQKVFENGLDVAQLVRDFYADVYRYAYHLSGQTAEAEDLAQEVFLSATKNLQQLREPDKVKQWLLRIVRNRFLKQRQRKQPVLAENLEINLETIASTGDEVGFDLERLHQVLQELPDEFRVVVLMHYFEFLPYQEIADELEVPVGTIMSRLSRAKQRLRAKLSTESDVLEPKR